MTKLKEGSHSAYDSTNGVHCIMVCNTWPHDKLASPLRLTSYVLFSDEALFQLVIGPIDYCIQWDVSSTITITNTPFTNFTIC